MCTKYLSNGEIGEENQVSSSKAEISINFCENRVRELQVVLGVQRPRQQQNEHQNLINNREKNLVVEIISNTDLQDTPEEININGKSKKQTGKFPTLDGMEDVIEELKTILIISINQPHIFFAYLQPYIGFLLYGVRFFKIILMYHITVYIF